MISKIKNPLTLASGFEIFSGDQRFENWKRLRAPG
jgi:hypothetical protein